MDVFVLDDVDKFVGAEPPEVLVRMLAQRGAVVICSVTRSAVVPSGADFGPLAESWARSCDVVIDVADDPDPCRPGEADLRLLGNRRGPRSAVPTPIQYHYGRFADLAR